MHRIVITFLFLTSCASYNIPIQTESHPACTEAPTTVIVLSPILDIENESCDGS